MEHQLDSHDNQDDDPNDKVMSTTAATNNIHTPITTTTTTMNDDPTTTTHTADVSLESMRWLLLGGDDSSDHVLNTLLVSSSSLSSTILLNLHQLQHPLQNSNHHDDDNHDNKSNTSLETLDADHVVDVNDDGNGIDDVFDIFDDDTCDIFDLEDIDDDISSVMSDVGLLDDIDFEFNDDYYPIALFNNYDHDDKEDVTIRKSTNNNTNEDHEMDQDHHQHSSTNEQKDPSFLRKQRRRRRRRRDTHHHHQKQRISLLLKIQQQELQKKFQQRQIYLQQQEQSRRPRRVLQPIKEREVISMTLQFNQLQKESNSSRSSVTIKSNKKSNPIHTLPTTIRQDGSNSFFRHIYDFIVFEYYLTIPAGIAIVFHSIIMIAIYDLIHELVLYTYTDVLPTFYTYMIIGLSSLLLPTLPLPIFSTMIRPMTEYITPWLGIHHYYYAYYDNLFYMAMCIVGVYMIQLSGYLYWWLSDYDYTILKYDTHNRIRLLQWIPTTLHYKQNKNNSNNNNVQTSTKDDDDNTTTATPTAASSTKWTSKQQRNHSLSLSSSSSLSTRTKHDKNGNRHNFVNTFVCRFYKVRHYPILRLMLYMIGYFIIYMISQLIVSNTYPYFSQHETILPHLPSLTFDKHYYHLVDPHTIDDSLLSSSSSISNHNDNVLFPCVVQTCRMEIERQQQANMELILAERLYTKPQLAYMSYLGYWSTFVEQYGEKSIYPLFDTIRNRFYTVEDDDEDDEYEDDEDDDVKETRDEETEDAPVRRKHTGTIVDFQSMPVFNNVGEIVFSVVALTIGIVLLRGYGFIFWQKY